jgi:hypothetical protein
MIRIMNINGLSYFQPISSRLCGLQVAKANFILPLCPIQKSPPLIILHPLQVQ